MSWNVMMASSADTGEPGDVRIKSALGGIKDEGPAWTSSFGVLGAVVDNPDNVTQLRAVTDLPTSGKKLVITDLLISVDTATRVRLTEETAGTVKVSLYMAANSSVQYTPRSKIKLGTADKRLLLTTTVSANVAVGASYYSET